MIKAVLIDLSGTLHIENQAIPGAAEALKRLQATNLQIKFVTNTTKESSRILHERLCSLGFPVQKKDIFSSLAAAKSLILAKKLRPMLLLSPEAMEDFEGLDTKPEDNPSAVVIGLAPTEFHYDRLNLAFRSLMNGAHLIGIHAGRYYKRSDGLALGPGCFVKGLEYSSGRKAELVGKPNDAFFKQALGDVEPENAVMIGDDVIDDVMGAMSCGMMGYLVKTGKYQEGDENKIAAKPTAVVQSFVEAVDKILEQIGC